ncbi:MAG TPA: hypothetical protein VHM92_10590 [Allosphingosinicella sp.]|nr:hypothetical protein [Allosphingosinicella sp.]
MSDATDLRLAALLRHPERGPDEAFVLRTRQAVLIERRLVAARRKAWTRFAFEMAAAGAAIAAFWLLARLAPADSDGVVGLFSPTAAGLVLLVLWLIVSLRPSGGAIARSNAH